MRFYDRSQRVFHALPRGARSTVPRIVLLLALCMGVSTPALGQSEPSGDEDAPATYGPVSTVDTMWRIASENRPASGITVHQYMLALLEHNPDAFHAANVNLLREGAVLELPGPEAATAVSPAEASRRIDEQMRWHAALSGEEIDAITGDETDASMPLAEPANQPIDDPLGQPASPPEATQQPEAVDEPAQAAEPAPVDAGAGVIPDLELDVVQVRPGADPVGAPEDVAAEPEADEPARPQPPVTIVEPLPEGLLERLASSVAEPTGADAPGPADRAGAEQTPKGEMVRSSLPRPGWLVAALVAILLLFAAWLWWRLRSRTSQSSARHEGAYEQSDEPGAGEGSSAVAAADGAVKAAKPSDPKPSDPKPSDPKRPDPEKPGLEASGPKAPESAPSEDEWSHFDAALLGTGGPAPASDRVDPVGADPALALQARDADPEPPERPEQSAEPRSVVDELFESFAEDESEIRASAPEEFKAPSRVTDTVAAPGEKPAEPPIEAPDPAGEPEPDEVFDSGPEPSAAAGPRDDLPGAVEADEQVDLFLYSDPGDETEPDRAEPPKAEDNLPEVEGSPADAASAGPADEPQPDTDAPALDDADAAVMLDLATMTGREGDRQYARNLLEEIMRDGSEAMASRAREVRSELDS